ncbi:MAG: hypothetical protein UV67_C0005G0023 [Parcubacteria group bacterium GW2011_GWC1_43_12]|nr:MAG: hypothetical protein UV67_C0005G0023 [Parcubacteria group bacterium GW2011_GWC1_43_12]
MAKFSKIASIFFIIFLAFFAASFCYAEDPGGGTLDTGGGTVGNNSGSYSIPNPLGSETNDFSTFVLRVINELVEKILTPLVAVMIIWAGFKFVTAGGNEVKIQDAKKNLRYAITGLAVIVSAQAIVIYVREILGDANLEEESTLMDRIKGALNEITMILFMLATVYFGWGIVQMIQSSGNEKKLEEGKKHMIWGIVGMTIMMGVWGIIALVVNFLGIEPNQ